MNFTAGIFRECLISLTTCRSSVLKSFILTRCSFRRLITNTIFKDYDYLDPHFGRIVKDGGEILPEGCADNSQATKYQVRSAGRANLEASNQFFAHVVEEIHRRGMKVILDGVFNHCGSFNKWMDREKIYLKEGTYEPGAYISADSPYRDFFKFYNEDPGAWPDNGNYDGWWGHETLPKLNYEESVKLENYILRIGKKMGFAAV